MANFGVKYKVTQNNKFIRDLYIIDYLRYSIFKERCFEIILNELKPLFSPVVIYIFFYSYKKIRINNIGITNTTLLLANGKNDVKMYEYSYDWNAAAFIILTRYIRSSKKDVDLSKYVTKKINVKFINI